MPVFLEHLVILIGLICTKSKAVVQSRCANDKLSVRNFPHRIFRRRRPFDILKRGAEGLSEGGSGGEGRFEGVEAGAAGEFSPSVNISTK